MRKKIKILLLILLFIIVFVISAIISMNITGSAPQKLLSVEANNFVGTIYTDLSYENQNDNKYDLYVPEGLDKNENQQLILFIHGGSFNSGSKEDFDLWCKYYASHGYITATIDYTLQMQGLEADLNLMNEEIWNAVNAIFEESNRLGYHVTEMATAGVSAGGTLAMNYAYKHADTSPIPVRFIFQLAAPVDFEPKDWGLLMKVNGIKTELGFVELMTGAQITDAMMVSGEYTPYIDAISPARLVNENSVPTLSGYGLRDHCVSVELKYLLFDALEKYDVPYDYIEFPNSNHGMYSDLDKLEEFLSMSLEYCEKYFSKE